MILNSGKARLLSQITSDMSNGQWGTGTTLWNANDTALETPVAATDITLDVNKVTGDVIITSHVLPSGTASGNAITEYAVENGSGTAYNRILYAALNKTDQQVTSIVSFYWRIV